MANYSAVLKVLSQAVLDAKFSVIDEFLTFLETKVEVDEDLKALVAEFKGSLKADKVAKPTKSKKSASSSDESTESDAKPKRLASVFNLYVKEMMPILKEKNPDVKNGKDLMALASESWKTDAFGLFVKEKVVDLKKENPALSNVELYAAAKAAYTEEPAPKAAAASASDDETDVLPPPAETEDESEPVKKESKKVKEPKTKAAKTSKGKGKKVSAKVNEPELTADSVSDDE